MISVIYAITNNVVLTSIIYGGFYFLSYWKVEGIYELFPVHIYLVFVAFITLIALRSNPKALESKPLVVQADIAMSHKG